MSRKRKPKHTATSKWTDLTGDRRGIIEKLYRIVTWIVVFEAKCCVTCGMKNKRMMAAGHLFSRVRLATAFDYLPGGNNSAQCHRCNSYHEDDPEPYERYFKKTYGTAVFNEVKQRWDRDEHMDTAVLVEMLEERETYWAAIQNRNGGTNGHNRH